MSLNEAPFRYYFGSSGKVFGGYKTADELRKILEKVIEAKESGEEMRFYYYPIDKDGNLIEPDMEEIET